MNRKGNCFPFLRLKSEVKTTFILSYKRQELKRKECSFFAAVEGGKNNSPTTAENLRTQEERIFCFLMRKNELKKTFCCKAEWRRTRKELYISFQSRRTEFLSMIRNPSLQGNSVNKIQNNI